MGTETANSRSVGELVAPDVSVALGILDDLIGFDTVSRRSNLPLIDYVETMMSTLGGSCKRIYNADRSKASLLASFGALDGPGIVLSAHTDVVPVDDQNWSYDPFKLAIANGRAYGRGAADMKGFIAVCLATVQRLAGKLPSRPVHLALSFDEELGCLGAPSLARALAETYGRQRLIIVGEPTSMRPVIGHKSNLGLEIVVTGHAAHSSLAPLTVNAVEVAGRFVHELALMQAEAASAASDNLYDVPFSTVTVTQIEGGTAINIVPDHCRLVCEFRLLPELDGSIYVNRLRALADELRPSLRSRAPDADIQITEIFSYPGLSTPTGEPALTTVLRAAGRNTVEKVAYGTEAGVFAAITKTPTVVIGPGSIEQAHKPDEFVSLEQLAACQTFLTRLLAGAVDDS